MKNHILVIYLLFPICLSAQDKYTLDTLYTPAKGIVKDVAIISFGGSGGGLHQMNTHLSLLGYPVLSVGYFNTEHTPEELIQVPIDYIEQAINDFSNLPEIKGKKLVVKGGSKGGELVLLLGSMFPQIDGVIASAPSHVVWQGITWDSLSSWSYRGKELPFVPYYENFDASHITNQKYLELYTISLLQTKALEQAAIPVEKINGPVLMISGDEDASWPSTIMSQLAMNRLREKEFPFMYQHFHYPDANHSLSQSGLGGTIKGNTYAQEHYNKVVIEFLEALNTKGKELKKSDLTTFDEFVRTKEKEPARFTQINEVFYTSANAKRLFQLLSKGLGLKPFSQKWEKDEFLSGGFNFGAIDIYINASTRYPTDKKYGIGLKTNKVSEDMLQPLSDSDIHHSGILDSASYSEISLNNVFPDYIYSYTFDTYLDPDNNFKDNPVSFTKIKTLTIPSESSKTTRQELIKLPGAKEMRKGLFQFDEGPNLQLIQSNEQVITITLEAKSLKEAMAELKAKEIKFSQQSDKLILSEEDYGFRFELIKE